MVELRGEGFVESLTRLFVSTERAFRITVRMLKAKRVLERYVYEMMRMLQDQSHTQINTAYSQVYAGCCSKKVTSHPLLHNPEMWGGFRRVTPRTTALEIGEHGYDPSYYVHWKYYILVYLEELIL